MPMYHIRVDGIFANVVSGEVPADHFRQEFHFFLEETNHYDVLYSIIDKGDLMR